jgi:hypothetical protein
MGSAEKRPKLTEELLKKLIYIEDNKGPDGWTDSPMTKIGWSAYHSVTAGIHPDLLESSPSGDKVKLSEGGSFLVKWCR